MDKETTKLLATYRRLVEQSARLGLARASLPTGSSRARITSANAKWARVAEERDRVEAILVERGLMQEELRHV